MSCTITVLSFLLPRCSQDLGRPHTRAEGVSATFRDEYVASSRISDCYRRARDGEHGDEQERANLWMRAVSV